MLNNEALISEVQKLNNVFNTKDSFSLHPVIKSTEPYYILPQPIILQSARKYRASLVDFSSDNYFENINEVLNNNKFFYSSDQGTTWKMIKIERGFYDIDEYNNEIKRQMIDNERKENNPSKTTHITISGSLSLYKSVIEITHENYVIDFTRPGTFRENLGFEKIKLSKGRHIGTKRLQITHIKRINIHCDLITGGYNSQGKKTDIILSYPIGEFSPGQVVALRPNVPFYLPVVKDVIDKITFKIIDQNGFELKSEGEEITFNIGIEQV
jgi:hypothetical protein